MKGSPHEVVLNEFIPTKFKANINFGYAENNLLARIYNWRVSHLQMKIFLALADVTTFFCFPRMHADLTKKFGFMVDNFFFLATSMVFGSNASASSWEPFRRAIQALIPVYLMRTNIINKYKHLLDTCVWSKDDIPVSTLVQAFKCPINPVILDQHGPLEAYIYGQYFGLCNRKIEYAPTVGHHY
jgi:hypothetical protein